MKDVCAAFAARLKTRRQALGITQRDIANALGYSEKTVSKWESGVMVAPSVVLPRLAKLLHTDVNSLLATADDCYLLGVDGGGTKTDFLLTDEGGRVISQAHLEGCNPVDVGFAKCREILTRGISEVCADIPTSSVYAFVGIAGGITGTARERVHGILAEFGFANFQNGSDAENAVATALGDGEGTAVIIGTGTVAFTRAGGELIRRGGWGYLLEEGGSGFSIGRDAMMHGLKVEESGYTDALTDALRAALGEKTLLSAIGRLYEGGKRAFASLAQAVLDLAENGDPTCTAIVERNMQAIARLIESTPRDESRKKQTIVVIGGLANKSELLLPMIENRLENPENYELSACRERPVIGALRLAKGLKEGTPC